MIEDSDLSLDRVPGHLRPPGALPPPAAPKTSKGKARENVAPLSFSASTSTAPAAASPSAVDPYADLREHIEDAEFEADFGLDPDAKPDDELVIFEQDEQSDSQEVRLCTPRCR